MSNPTAQPLGAWGRPLWPAHCGTGGPRALFIGWMRGDLLPLAPWGSRFIPRLPLQTLKSQDWNTPPSPAPPCLGVKLPPTHLRTPPPPGCSSEQPASFSTAVSKGRSAHLSCTFARLLCVGHQTSRRGAMNTAGQGGKSVHLRVKGTQLQTQVLTGAVVMGGSASSAVKCGQYYLADLLADQA